MLGQGSPHCPIFPTAASRRSLGRVSVPVWPYSLSARLPIADLVGHYPANYLMGREPSLQRISPFTTLPCGNVVLCGINSGFPELSPSDGTVAHVLLTRPPLRYPRIATKSTSVRLACVRHAASVRPEPGSNSLLNPYSTHSLACFFPSLLYGFQSAVPC